MPPEEPTIDEWLTDEYWSRDKALARLKAINGDPTKIEQWNNQWSAYSMSIRGKDYRVDLSKVPIWSSKNNPVDLPWANLHFYDEAKNEHIGINLSYARLEYAELNNTDLENADLNGADLRNANVTGITYNRQKMRGKYRGVRGLESCYGNTLFKRDAQDQDYIDSLHQKWNGSLRIVWYWLWWLTDFGRSFGRVFVIAFLIALWFGGVYLSSESSGGRFRHGDAALQRTYTEVVVYTVLLLDRHLHHTWVRRRDTPNTNRANPRHHRGDPGLSDAGPLGVDAGQQGRPPGVTQ